MIEVVTSKNNKTIKMITALKQKKYRDEYQLFIAEGVRLVEEAIQSDWDIHVCVYSAAATSNQRIRHILQVLHDRKCQVIEVTEKVYQLLSDTEQPQGIMAVLKQKTYRWEQLPKVGQIIIIMDQVQDPGNVGTIIRTADAAGCSAVIMTDGCADVYAAKTVRAAMGSLFHLPVIYGWDRQKIIDVLCKNHILLIATTLSESSVDYFKADFTKPCAIVFGNEGNGVGGAFLENSAASIHIPMLGKAESLNVAVSSAIILYEAVRQRGF